MNPLLPHMRKENRDTSTQEEPFTTMDQEVAKRFQHTHPDANFGPMGDNNEDTSKKGE